jgi:endonuclease G
MLTRRELLMGACAGLAVASAASGPAIAEEQSRTAEFLVDVEAGPSEFAPTAEKVSSRCYQDWVRNALAQKRDPLGWEADPAKSADCAHLGAPLDPSPFEVSPALLDRHAAASRYKLPDRAAQPLVVVGVRGAALAGGGGPGVPAAAECDPDHIRLRCLLGVWNRREGTVTLFPGSTVPDADHMWFHVVLARDGETTGPKCDRQGKPGGSATQACNMLPPGLYAATVGKHNTNPGCLLIGGLIMTRRTFDGMAYGISSWAPSAAGVGDHVHPAYWDNDEINVPKFSSAGCQVIAGGFDEPGGPFRRKWTEFRQALGMRPDHRTLPATGPADGTAIPYLLCTGRELRLLAGGKSLPRLRHGSSGPEAEALAAALGLKPRAGAPLDGAAIAKLVAWQADKKLPTHGVATPEVAAALGFKLA